MKALDHSLQASNPVTHKPNFWDRLARNSKTNPSPPQTDKAPESKSSKGIEVKTHHNILWHVAKKLVASVNYSSPKDKPETERRASDPVNPTQPPARHASTASSASSHYDKPLPARPPVESESSRKHFLSAATREAWSSKDPGPNRAAQYYALGYSCPSTYNRTPTVIETDFGLEPYQFSAMRSISRTSEYDLQLPGAVAEPKDSPSRTIAGHMQRYTSATQAYQRTNAMEAALQANPSSSVYLSNSKIYLELSAKTDLDDVTRIGYFKHAMTSAEYAMSLGSTEAVTMLWHMNRDGLRNLQNPTMNIDSSQDTSFWFKVSGLLSNPEKLEQYAESFRLHGGSSPLLQNPQPHHKMAILIHISNLVHPEDKQYSIIHAKEWWGFQYSTKTSHNPHQVCGIPDKVWNEYKAAIITSKNSEPWQRF